MGNFSKPEKVGCFLVFCAHISRTVWNFRMPPSFLRMARRVQKIGVPVENFSPDGAKHFYRMWV